MDATTPFDSEAFLAAFGGGRAVQHCRKHRVIFAQGDPANAVFYVLHGTVKLTTLSPRGKEAVIAILNDGLFFGEGCLGGQPVRNASAVAMTECSLVKLRKSVMVRVLREEPQFSEIFIAHLLRRSIRIEEDLIDHLFNSSEKRLARILLLLAKFGQGPGADDVIANFTQEMLAEMIGTTRSRVSYFLNKFRKLGLIEYRSISDGMRVCSSLQNVILHD
jgi:CRP/FNR family cyclic AMP-dependent transcriptional regulator